MSVQTTADERLDSAKKHLDAAHADLLVVLSKDTYGHDEFKSDYINKIYAALKAIHDIKSSI